MTVTAGAPSQIAITIPPPGSGASTSPLTPATVITVTDAQGNVVSGVNVTVTIETGTSTLSGTLIVATDENGQATFSNIIIADPGSYTLKFSVGALNTISTTIAIS